MKKITIIAGLLILGSAAAAWAVNKITEDTVYKWRYKMTVEVETPEGLKTGSAVREVVVTFESRPMYPKGYHSFHKMRGEAVAVDLGKRGVLFALIGPDSYPEFIWNFEGDSAAFTPKVAKHYANLKNKKAVMDPTRYPNYPQLVMFEDINDPMTVQNVIKIERVDGTRRTVKVYDRKYAITENRMEELFGEGVKIKQIIIETTDEPIEWKIRQYLPWLEKLRGGYLHGGNTSRGAPLGLYGGNLEIGVSYGQ